MKNVLAAYQARVDAGDFEFDSAQALIAERLTALNERLSEHHLARKSSALGWLFGKKNAEPVRGLYIWGEVGRGKTMLMELFFLSSPVKKKKRVHFHEFLADVHERIHLYRRALKEGKVKGDDPIVPVADQLADEAWLLCFDEFTVTDIADAMILGRLFKRLFERDVVVVATSNVVPSELYKGGLNRALFVPFIHQFETRMEVVKLESRTDFRLEKLSGHPVWVTPLGPEADAAMDTTFAALTNNEAPLAQTLIIKGHELHVPRRAMGVARFTFDELCGQPLGASDYLALAHAFHTIMIDHIPVLEYDRRNEAKRLIILIDALYDNHVKLIASAESQPIGLYLGEDGREAFEFARTASRLFEMRSAEYLAAPHGRRDSEASGDSTGLVET